MPGCVEWKVGNNEKVEVARWRLFYSLKLFGRLKKKKKKRYKPKEMECEAREKSLSLKFSVVHGVMDIFYLPFHI